jgi:hypothetical protein
MLLTGMVIMVMSMTNPTTASVGEFDIPGVLPLNAEQTAFLRKLVREDPEAMALAKQEIAAAQPWLNAQPRPVEIIHYEGLVNTDPKRIACVEHLKDMTGAAILVRYWQATGNAQAARTLKEFILAWTGTYKLTGNDVNENKFFPLLVAYESLREELFDDQERAKVDAWVRELGELHHKEVLRSRHFTNRYTKHVRLLAMCARILDNESWALAARHGVKRFVTNSLYADGESLDLKRRDTLTYHGSSLKPPLDLAMLAGEDGYALYTWESPKGGSLKKSVDYVVPYAMGEKTHKEWVNSKVDLDRRRAEAGLEKYRPGRLYEPRNALELMEKAGYFDPELMKVVLHLTESSAERFPTWQTLINEAARAGRETPSADDAAPSP